MNHKLVLHQLRNLTRSRRKNGTTNINAIEHTIVSLQEYFLTPGTHYVTVPTIEQGRSLLRVCLDSLGLYNNIGMLTACLRKAPAQYHDIYGELTSFQSLALDNGILEDYMLSSFNCDFLVIEYSQELMKQPWFGKFENLLHEYSLASSLPVLMLFYENGKIHTN